MRLEYEAPATQFEREVETILINSGYRIEDIQFRGDQRYLRVGYWKYLSNEAFEKLGDRIKEVVDYDDDDCGTLYHYVLNHKNQ
jgi:hypothetical protein